MWRKKLSAALAVAAIAACSPLSAGDSCTSAKCHDGKKDASCHKTMTDPCAMPGQKVCGPHRKIVKITPIQKASDPDPGFIAVWEEYTITTEVPVQGQTPESGAVKAENAAK